MTKLGPNPSPEDTLKAYNKILDIRNKILSGNIGFEEAAEELSEDQADYIGVKVEGPFKPEYYRY